MNFGKFLLTFGKIVLNFLKSCINIMKIPRNIPLVGHSIFIFLIFFLSFDISRLYLSSVSVNCSSSKNCRTVVCLDSSVEVRMSSASNSRAVFSVDNPGLSLIELFTLSDPVLRGLFLCLLCSIGPCSSATSTICSCATSTACGLGLCCSNLGAGAICNVSRTLRGSRRCTACTVHRSTCSSPLIYR